MPDQLFRQILKNPSKGLRVRLCTYRSCEFVSIHKLWRNPTTDNWRPREAGRLRSSSRTRNPKYSTRRHIGSEEMAHV